MRWIYLSQKEVGWSLLGWAVLWNLFEVGMELKHTKLVKRKRNGDFKKFDVTKFSDEKKKKKKKS